LKSHWTTPVQTKVSPGFWKARFVPGALIVLAAITFFFLTGYRPAPYQKLSHGTQYAAFPECRYLAVQAHMPIPKSHSSVEKRPGVQGLSGYGDVGMGEGFMYTLRSRLLSSLDSEDLVSNEAARDLLDEIERERSIMARTPSRIPASGVCTSLFGWRDSPITGEREFHKGIDIASADKSPVYAPADGAVCFYGRYGDYGNTMEIDHGSGIRTLYGHLRESAVKTGQQVKRGEKIAYTGDSGRTTGTHLHYEVIVGGVSVDPQRYMLK
jgi:hypothetical protein